MKNETHSSAGLTSKLSKDSLIRITKTLLSDKALNSLWKKKQIKLGGSKNAISTIFSNNAKVSFSCQSSNGLDSEVLFLKDPPYCSPSRTMDISQ